jgi:hypothetical protein
MADVVVMVIFVLLCSCRCIVANSSIIWKVWSIVMCVVFGMVATAMFCISLVTWFNFIRISFLTTTACRHWGFSLTVVHHTYFMQSDVITFVSHLRDVIVSFNLIKIKRLTCSPLLICRCV